MKHYLFTSESVAMGHPDKVADQISDAILDATLREDPDARVACETLVTTGLIVLSGEITTTAHPNYPEIARQTIKEIGYTDSAMGFDYKSCGVLVSFNKQSPDIARGVNKTNFKEQGAGDQGLMFGYACDDTPELMPLPIMLAHRYVRELKRLRITHELKYLRPDAKTQVTVEYNQKHHPVRVHTIVISTQHSPETNQSTIVNDMKTMVRRLTPNKFIDEKTIFYINSTGRFVVGGPEGDCGLTGRKIIVDTYGGMGRHGGGAFSGKDPSKVDRSASYAARYIAKNIVAAKLAKRCEVQIAYAIGIPYPISIKVDTFGTGKVDESELEKAIPLIFNLSPAGIIEMLNLKRPIYFQTAFGGHFGRPEIDFTWENNDKAPALLEALKKRKKPLKTAY